MIQLHSKCMDTFQAYTYAMRADKRRLVVFLPDMGNKNKKALLANIKLGHSICRSP